MELMCPVRLSRRCVGAIVSSETRSALCSDLLCPVRLSKHCVVTYCVQCDSVSVLLWPIVSSETQSALCSDLLCPVRLSQRCVGAIVSSETQ